MEVKAKLEKPVNFLANWRQNKGIRRGRVWCLFVMTGAPKLNKIQRNKAGIHEPDTEQIIHYLEPFSNLSFSLAERLSLIHI